MLFQFIKIDSEVWNLISGLHLDHQKEGPCGVEEGKKWLWGQTEDLEKPRQGLPWQSTG